MAVTGTFGGFYFDPDVFTDYIQEVDPVHTSIINSGVLRVSPDISAVLTDKNNVFTVPNYAPLSGDAKNYDGETDNTPVEVSANKQTGMAFRRMAAWKDQDFTRELTGADPLGDVARKVAYYQQKNNQKELLSIVDGVLGVSGMNTHVRTFPRAARVARPLPLPLPLPRTACPAILSLMPRRKPWVTTSMT